MRKVTGDIKEVIKQITQLKGETVKMQVNKGRKRMEKYEGIIESVYPSIFTVLVFDPDGEKHYSFSHSEVLCGDVKVQKING
ncbi:MAG: Veg family protein [Clostridia bacterium]|nr:Veg family protein [Clostridia bacterium]